MSTPQRPKKQPSSDWHRADIVAALRKAGWSLRRLSLHHGYSSPNTLTNALDRHWPKGERLVAEAIGVDPAIIWPTRYPGKTPTGPDDKRSEAHSLGNVKRGEAA